MNCSRSGGDPSGIRHDLKLAGGEASDELLQATFGRGQVIIETLNAAGAFGIQGEDAELQNHGRGRLVWNNCRGSGGSEAVGVDTFQTVCLLLPFGIIQVTFQRLAAMDEFVNQRHHVLGAGQVALHFYQEFQVIFLLLPTYHTLSRQAAMVNRDGSSTQKRFLVQHEAVDPLCQGGALLLS